MATTTLAQVEDQMQKYWAPISGKKLRENLLLGTLVNKEYEGTIAKGGDRVRVSQIVDVQGELLDVGVNAGSFNSESLTTVKVDITANKRAVASFEFEDLVEIQSLIDKEDPKVMDALYFAMRRQINNYLYSLVAPSTSAPDHSISGVSDFNSSELAAARIRAAQALWMEEPGWYGLLDPQFNGDLMSSSTIVSSDFGASDAPTISGKIGMKRFGFNLFEDNSAIGAGKGISQISPTNAVSDLALLFHPDFLHLVMQTEPKIKISDLHAQKRFGYVMSVDVIFGAALGINGSKLHQVIYNA